MRTSRVENCCSTVNFYGFTSDVYSVREEYVKLHKDLQNQIPRYYNCSHIIAFTAVHQKKAGYILRRFGFKRQKSQLGSHNSEVYLYILTKETMSKMRKKHRTLKNAVDSIKFRRPPSNLLKG